MRLGLTISAAALAVVAALVAPTHAQFSYRFSDSDSEYIHSNDTIALELDPTSQIQLYGAAGSIHSIGYTVINKGMQGHFSISQQSGDNFLGVLSSREMYLATNQQQTIQVTNMRVPDRPEGTKVVHTLRVVRDSGIVRKRRDAQENQPRGQYQGNDGNNPNFPGMGNNRPGIGGGGGLFSPMDPSYRSEISLTIEFRVTSSMDDDKAPWVKIHYGAEDKAETCSMKLTDPNCNDDYWWVKVDMSDDDEDSDSGLKEVDFIAEGQNMYGNDIIYRYKNFHIGTNQEEEVVAAASCCLEKMRVRVFDVSGNLREETAYNGGTGAKLNQQEIWYIVGGVLAFVVLVVIAVLVFCCCCKDGKCTGTCGGMNCCGYSGVSTD